MIGVYVPVKAVIVDITTGHVPESHQLHSRVPIAGKIYFVQEGGVSATKSVNAALTHPPIAR